MQTAGYIVYPAGLWRRIGCIFLQVLTSRGISPALSQERSSHQIEAYINPAGLYPVKRSCMICFAQGTVSLPRRYQCSLPHTPGYIYIISFSG